MDLQNMMKQAKEMQEPPEPAWMKAFRKAYELKDGEYVKRVAPPYIEERKEYMYRVWYPKKQTPEDEQQAREHLDQKKLFLVLFLEYDGAKLTRRTTVSVNNLVSVPEFQSGEKIMNVWDAVTYITGRESPEVVIDPKSIDHPLLSTKEEQIDFPTKDGGGKSRGFVGPRPSPGISSPARAPRRRSWPRN